jgi:hypothetical protein
MLAIAVFRPLLFLSFCSEGGGIHSDEWTFRKHETNKKIKQ